jgi:hypothetical protein
LEDFHYAGCPEQCQTTLHEFCTAQRALQKAVVPFRPPQAIVSVLLAEPNRELAELLKHSAPALADVHWHSDFDSARCDLRATSFQFIITNLRLNAYNGLHLIHLAGTSALSIRSIVYTDEYNPHLARDAQRAGAFYETRACLTHSLRGYLQQPLPPRDRRDPGVRDRRATFRGGRRSWDQPALHGAA